MKDLRIIVTGGTIDKVHDPKTEGLAFSPDGATHIPELLRIGRCHFPVVDLLMLKDSLYFDESDREAIARAVTTAPEEAVVLTHGTGTMGQTARFLAPLVQGKTVVLTGAMRPYLPVFLGWRVQPRGRGCRGPASWSRGLGRDERARLPRRRARQEYRAGPVRRLTLRTGAAGRPRGAAGETGRSADQAVRYQAPACGRRA